MAMSAEQLTSAFGELREELVRRAQEHQSQHALVQTLQTMVEELDRKVTRATDEPGRSSEMRGTLGSANVEMHKRLDRWATSSDGKAFAGGETGISLKEWILDMKERAGYCSEHLRVAMEHVERSPTEVTPETLMEKNLSSTEDQALRMAVLRNTSGIAKQFVQNNRSQHPGWTGLEHWRMLIAQFDPINTRVTQQERSVVMQGATSRSWTEFETK